MPTHNQQPVRHSNQYSADSACAYCSGIIRHELWCITQNVDVCYAHRVALFPDELSLEDQIILHAWGVAWHAESVSSN